MASCSRDSTVRLWSLTPLISPLLLNIVTDQPWEKIMGNTGERKASNPFCVTRVWNLIHTCWRGVSADIAMVPGSPPLLCGKVSRDIKQELDKLSADIRAKKLRWFSECFSVTTVWIVMYGDCVSWSVFCLQFSFSTLPEVYTPATCSCCCVYTATMKPGLQQTDVLSVIPVEMTLNALFAGPMGPMDTTLRSTVSGLEPPHILWCCLPLLAFKSNLWLSIKNHFGGARTKNLYLRILVKNLHYTYINVPTQQALKAELKPDDASKHLTRRHSGLQHTMQSWGFNHKCSFVCCAWDSH